MLRTLWTGGISMGENKKVSEKTSEFNGGLLGWFCVTLLVNLSIVFTFGLLLPFALCKRERYFAKHTIIDGKQLEFFGKPYLLFIRHLGMLILGPILVALGAVAFTIFAREGSGDFLIAGFSTISLVTLLFFTLLHAWVSRRMKRWIIRHTRFE